MTILVLGLAAAFELLSGSAYGQGTSRLVDARPDSGLLIETDRGFMVPYRAKIPGSGATFDMVPVPGGSLRCRQPSGELAVVDIPPFWIGKCEVTWHEYAGFMSLNTQFRAQRQVRKISLQRIDAVTAPTAIYDISGRFEFATSPDCPATTMSQFAARQYTKWLSILLEDQYRLPSEAEWTYACLAPANRVGVVPGRVPSAEELTAQAVFGKTEGGPLPVGERTANAFGLHDMLGNVYEWVLDANSQGSRLLQLPAGGYSVAQSIGSAQTRFAALACGGGCWDPAERCQPLARIVADEDLWNQDPDYPSSVSWMADFDKDRAIGFRVLRSLNDEPPAKMERYWLPDNEELRADVEMRIEWRDAAGVVQPGPIEWANLKFPFERPE